MLDVRSSDAYNGWQMNNEVRKGHIKGAKSFPAKWTNYIDWIEIARSKGILPEHELVFYGNHESEAVNVASVFASAGYKNIHLYKYFQEEMATTKNLAMEHLPNYRNLVPAEWVKNLITNEKTINNDTNKVVICHAHYRNRDAYLSGHIPGAIDIDTLALESHETWNRRSPGELEKALLQHGITADTTVVLYGKFMFPNNDDPFPGSAAGDIGAIRCAWIMMYAGVKDVRVLNGGFQAWQDAGYDIATDDVKKVSEKNFGAKIPVHPELIVDIKRAKELLASDKGELVSVRSWPEYIGEVSGYNYIEKKGRIPGSVFGNCGSDAYHMENYRNVDHTTREFHEIKKQWETAGITPEKQLAFYCGTGWRGSEACYNAWLMGWPNISVFDGGWFEWSSDPANPYETGIPATIPAGVDEEVLKK
ncbi:sulfurtransferase [Draconibacterium halophilum]|uniref:sulfurtransferase n=1 Tax=Draconibacterium halophilum TaxID=2706887 RepID=UPI001FEC060B|nr:rhodanese-like domain-containing protein [Draconibacterium halophilum]